MDDNEKDTALGLAMTAAEGIAVDVVAAGGTAAGGYSSRRLRQQELQ